MLIFLLCSTVPRGYEELVWILRCESCPPGLSVSDDSLSVGAGPGFRGGVGGAGLELTDNAAVGEITLFDPSSPAAGVWFTAFTCN